MPLKIIGSGMGRTGTSTLKIALEQLGFGKCYHMTELLQAPQNLHYFKDAEKGLNVDWDTLFQGYQSAVDYPVARYHKILAQKYPDAKIIHTIRDADSWYKSACETIFWASKPTPGRIFKMLIRMPFSPTIRKVMPVLKFNGKLVEWEFGKNISDKEAVVKKYNEYNEMVLQTTPKDRLLVFNVKDGWQPLCNFLQVPVPATPFPKKNTTSEFKSHVKAMSTGGPLAFE